MDITSAVNQFSNLTASHNDAVNTTKKKTSLGQDEFLKLMTTQMTHQDPSKPMDNGEFITQMAQFGTVSGIQDLQKSFADFANSITSSQALQASSLVGRQISAPGTKGLLTIGGDIKGDINLPSSATSVHLKVTSPMGELIKEIDLGQHNAGKMPFVWDGMNRNGVMANPGVYNIEATAYIDGKNTGLETDIYSKVESVNMGSGANGLKINLTGLDSINFNQIKQII